MTDLTPNERFYDEEIAPALRDLAKRCEERGLSMIAAVEYNPGEHGRTVTLREGHSMVMKNAHAALLAGLNMDALIGHIVRMGREHGNHSSMYLKMLGVEITGR